VRSHVEKARESALLAVEVYNKPATMFRSGAYITLMAIAWTALFHAVFLKRKLKPYYKEGRRYRRIDGDYAAWSLKECVRQFYGPDNPPERKNLEFFIPLRNKIEHRMMPALDEIIFGECQALLFNFEDLLFAEFGAKYVLNESLAMALQFSRVMDDAQLEAIRRQRRSLAPEIESYVNRYRSSLDVSETSNPRYSYKVFLIPKLANRQGQADVAVEFVSYDASRPDEMEQYAKLVAMIKPTRVPVSNDDCYKPSAITAAVEPVVQEVLGPDARFTASYHHPKAYEYYGIRPVTGAPNPEQTNAKYCHYDTAHGDYVYTAEWRDFLIAEMRKPGQYRTVMNAAAR
jgi:hypothetical protein